MIHLASVRALVGEALEEVWQHLVDLCMPAEWKRGR